MKKIDMHLHSTLNDVTQNNNMLISTAKEMKQHLNALSIYKAVLMSSGETDGDIIGTTNNDLYEIVKQMPETYSFMCNLDFKDIETVYDRLYKYKQLGAIGIGEIMINLRLDDKFLQEIFASAEKLDLPVTFHMSPEVGFSYGVVDLPRLPLLEQTLQQYPKCKFLGHSQAFWIEISADAPNDKHSRNQWGKGKVISGGRLPELFEKYDNLYGDLSANSGGCAIMRDEDFGIKFLERFSDRLFFASDMVNTKMEFPLGKWLDDMYENGKLSLSAYENICYKNAQRIFKL